MDLDSGMAWIHLNLSESIIRASFMHHLCIIYASLNHCTRCTGKNNLWSTFIVESRSRTHMQSFQTKDPWNTDTIWHHRHFWRFSWFNSSVHLFICSCVFSDLTCGSWDTWAMSEQRDLGEGSLLLVTVQTSDEIDWKQLVTSVSYVESIQFTQPTSNKLFLSSSPLPCGECRSVHACFKWLILASANATEMQVPHAFSPTSCWDVRTLQVLCRGLRKHAEVCKFVSTSALPRCLKAKASMQTYYTAISSQKKSNLANKNLTEFSDSLLLCKLWFEKSLG